MYPRKRCAARCPGRSWEGTPTPRPGERADGGGMPLLSCRTIIGSGRGGVPAVGVFWSLIRPRDKAAAEEPSEIR